jgi:hypothetical protein
LVAASNLRSAGTRRAGTGADVVRGHMSLCEISIETGKLPPMRWAARRVYDRFFEHQRRSNHYRGVYSSYADAMQQTPNNVVGGFDNDAATAKYRDQINELAVSEYLVLLWISRLIDQQRRRLSDLGGHFVPFCYALQRYRRLQHDLQWTICGLPAVIQPGKEWATGHDPSRQLISATAPQQHHPAEFAADPQDASLYRFDGRPARQAATTALLSRRQPDPDASSAGFLHYPEHGVLVRPMSGDVCTQFHIDDEGARLHPRRPVANRQARLPQTVLAKARRQTLLGPSFTTCQYQAAGGS